MKKTSVKKCISVFMAVWALVLSMVPVLPAKAFSGEPVVMLVGTSAIDFFPGLTPQTPDLMTMFKSTAEAVKILDESEVMEYYLNFDKVKKACDDIATYSSETASEVLNKSKDVLNDFLAWSFNALEKNSNLVSVSMRKIGYYVKTLDIWFNDLKGNPDNIPRLVGDLLRNKLIDMVVDPSKKYTISDRFIRTVKNVCDVQVNTERDKIYYVRPSLKLTEYKQADLYLEKCSEFDETYSGYFQKIYDKVRDEIYDGNHVGFLYIRTDSTRTVNFYDLGTSPCIRLSSSGSIFPDKVTYFLGSLDSENVPSYVGSKYGLDVSSDQAPWSPFYDFPCFRVQNSSWQAVLFGFVTSDGRDVIVWRSRQLYDQFHDWSNGCPYDSLVSDSYNNFDYSQDHSFTVGGNYVQNSDITNDYSQVVNNVVNNNDYSDNSVTNVVNNYYQSDVKDLDDNGNDNGGSSDSDGNGNWLTALLKGIGSLLSALAELVGGLFEIIGNILSGLIASLKNLNLFADDFGAFLGAQMTFLPPDAVAVIVAGISAIVTLAVIKYLKS